MLKRKYYFWKIFRHHITINIEIEPPDLIQGLQKASNLIYDYNFAQAEIILNKLKKSFGQDIKILDAEKILRFQKFKFNKNPS